MRRSPLDPQRFLHADRRVPLDGVIGQLGAEQTKGAQTPAGKARRHEAYFGALPSDRIEFTAGRDLILEPPRQGEPVDYFIYPYAEVEGRPVEKIPASFRFRRLETGAPEERDG